MEKIQKKVRGVLENVANNRALDPKVHAAWQVIHGVLAFGKDFEIVVDDQRQSAFDYLVQGGELAGWRFVPGQLFDTGRRGLRAELDQGSFVGQGHPDQWLAVMSQAGVSLDQELLVEGEAFQFRDWLLQVQWDLPLNIEQEWSWSLIALTQFLPTDAKWQASDGDEWSIERLLASELSQELEDSACGGTHRLIGIAMAVRRRRAENQPMNGVWAEASQVIREAVHYANAYQNADGSFSNNYFLRPGVSSDSAQVMVTTGHVLELLAISLSAEELRQPWVAKAVLRLCDVLEDAHNLPLECGALYHAVHGLVVYRDKIIGS